MVVDGVEILGIGAEIVDFGERYFAAFGEAEDFGAFGCIDEFAAGVEEFKGVPMLGVVGGGDDDAAISMFVDNRHFGGGGCGEARFDDVHAHSDEGADDEVVDHSAGEACIATDDEGERCGRFLTLEEGCESGGEFHHIDGAEAVAGLAADGAANA